MAKLHFKNSSFDIVTVSLSIDYVENIQPIFKEINHVLKKGGLFYYSNESPTSSARERYEDDNFKIVGIGKFVDKKSDKTIALGHGWDERRVEWEMIPGMIMKTCHKTFRTQLHALRQVRFELVDFIDCKPIPIFKKYDPDAYNIFTKFPLFSTHISRNK